MVIMITRTFELLYCEDFIRLISDIKSLSIDLWWQAVHNLPEVLAVLLISIYYQLVIWYFI